MIAAILVECSCRHVCVKCIIHYFSCIIRRARMCCVLHVHNQAIHDTHRHVSIMLGGLNERTHPANVARTLRHVSRDMQTTFPFFFQAEDGIRDFCLSRGLGDVYKRQVMASSSASASACSSPLDHLDATLERAPSSVLSDLPSSITTGDAFRAVSYTHLTLPTNREV